jgi:hypothetical protein
MKALSWALFVGGTLVAALCGVRLPPMWGPFAVGIVFAVVGAVLLRRQLAAEQAAGGSGAGAITGIEGLRAGLDGLIDDTAALAAITDADALKSGVEGVLLGRLMPIVSARLMLSAAHGIEAYAQVFTPIASGERCLNRAWSALVDGQPEVAGPEVVSARRHFATARTSWPTTGG